MASLRMMRPALQQATQITARPMAAPFRRFLNTDTAPVLTEAHATVRGARAEGHAKGDYLDISLDMPKALGGEGKYSNPEELFAAGYGACFQSAMQLVARQAKVELPQKLDDFAIETDVNLVGDLKAADLGLKVTMRVKARGVSKADLQKVVDMAEDVCPYSRATKGNISRKIEVVEM